MSKCFKVVRQEEDKIHQRHKQEIGETITAIILPAGYLLYHFLEDSRS